MIDRKTAVQDIELAFSHADYPSDFLATFDQLECLVSHRGRETFLVSEKETGRKFVAKCYDRTIFRNLPSENILRNLRHIGIPAAYSTYENDHMLCTVREYIDGVPLSVYTETHDLTQKEVVDICIRLADILIYLHGLNPPVIHRDIKPDNVIVKADGSIALIDFDIARTFKDTEETDTVFFGTKGYAPPEQYGFSQTDCRADIYSFGVLLRFLLTDSVRENRKIRIYRPLRSIISRCTAFAPEKRSSDMKQVRRALTKANPRSQALRIGSITLISVCVAAAALFAGTKLYQKMTYNPFTDGSVIPLVAPDDERQNEAIAYLQEKYGTHLFDDRSAYYTVGMLKDTLIEVYGMDEAYVRIPNPEDPPQESEEHFLPWSLDDAQYIDRDYLAYFVTKVYWSEVASDWSSLKESPSQYPGIIVSMNWCEEHGILIGVNRPRDVSCGEAAVAFANADKVYEIMKKNA